MPAAEPRWFESPSTHSWTDATTGVAVQFRACLVLPTGTASTPGTTSYPLAVYFPGMTENAGEVMRMKGDWGRLTKEPFVLVAPVKPNKLWWFIDDDSDWGWVKGDVRTALVRVYCEWLAALAELSHVNADRIGLFGWSAGAYAVTEIIGHGCIPLTGVGLGGVHGHGQRDVEGLADIRKAGTIEKFHAYLERLGNHGGVPWIEATHAPEDKESRWVDAQDIFQVLNERQAALGLPPVSVREVEPEQQDVKPNSKRNRQHHNYFQASFFREEFFIALLGGEQPDPDAEVLKKKARLMGEAPPVNFGQKSVDPNEECWDLKKKGYCPRGQACQYCAKASAKKVVNPMMNMMGMVDPMSNPMMGMMSMMMGMQGGMMSNWNPKSQASDDNVCWDMKKKGHCPRGATCKYCKASS